MGCLDNCRRPEYFKKGGFVNLFHTTCCLRCARRVELVGALTPDAVAQTGHHVAQLVVSNVCCCVMETGFSSLRVEFCGINGLFCSGGLPKPHALWCLAVAHVFGTVQASTFDCFQHVIVEVARLNCRHRFLCCCVHSPRVFCSACPPQLKQTNE